MKNSLKKLLLWSQKYTKIDMLYLTSGNFWLLVTRGIGILGGGILTIAFANLLPATTFGTYKYIISLTGFVTAFSLSGLSTALVRETAQNRKNLTIPLFLISILWSLPASLVTVGIAGYYYIHGNNVLAIGLGIIALTTPFSNGLGLFKGLMQGKKDFKVLSLYAIPNGFFPIICLLTTLFLTQNLLTIIIVYFLSNLTAGFFVFWLAIRRHKVQYANYDKNELNEAVNYGKHLSAIGFISQIASQIDQLLLFHFMGPVQLALYTFASSPLRELRSITENVFPLALPRFAVRSQEELQKNLPWKMFQMFIASALLALIYIIAAPFLFKIFFPKYIAAVGWSQILALALFVQPKGLIDTMLIAHAKIKQRYVATIMTNGLEIVLCIVLIPFMGIAGAVIATLASEVSGALALVFVLIYS